MRSAWAAIAWSCVTITIVRFCCSVQGAEDLDDLLARLLVQVAGGLVGQQEAGPGDQRPGDGRPLHFAAGKLARAGASGDAPGRPVSSSSAAAARCSPAVAQDTTRCRGRSSAGPRRFPAWSVPAGGDRTGRSCRTAVAQGVAARRRAGCRSAGPRSGFRPGPGRRACPAGAAACSCPSRSGPTIARNSPWRTLRLRPRSTGTRPGPCDSSLCRSRRPADRAAS